MKWIGLWMLLLPAAVQAQPQWQVEAATVTFEIVNAGWPVQGSFEGLEADLRFDPLHPEDGTIAASIDAATVRTGIGLRDKHLRKPDYFHVAHYPRIYMQANRISKTRDGRYEGVFALRIKDTEQEVTVPFSFRATRDTATLEGTFTINRLDFGLGVPSRILSEEVVVHIALEVSARHAGTTPVTQ